MTFLFIAGFLLCVDSGVCVRVSVWSGGVRRISYHAVGKGAVLQKQELWHLMFCG